MKKNILTVILLILILVFFGITLVTVKDTINDSVITSNSTSKIEKPLINNTTENIINNSNKELDIIEDKKIEPVVIDADNLIKEELDKRELESVAVEIIQPVVLDKMELKVLDLENIPDDWRKFDDKNYDFTFYYPDYIKLISNTLSRGSFNLRFELESEGELIGLGVAGYNDLFQDYSHGTGLGYAANSYHLNRENFCKIRSGYSQRTCVIDDDNISLSYTKENISNASFSGLALSSVSKLFPSVGFEIDLTKMMYAVEKDGIASKVYSMPVHREEFLYENIINRSLSTERQIIIDDFNRIISSIRYKDGYVYNDDIVKCLNSDVDKKEQCYINYLSQINNISDCEWMPDGEYDKWGCYNSGYFSKCYNSPRRTCLNKFAKESMDIKLCNIFVDASFKNKCYEVFEEEINNIKVCSLLLDNVNYYSKRSGNNVIYNFKKDCLININSLNEKSL